MNTIASLKDGEDALESTKVLECKPSSPNYMKMFGMSVAQLRTEKDVVTIQTPFEGAKEAAFLATSSSEPLRSWFTPSYGMVLNLLSTRNLQDCEHFLARSFLRFQTAGNVEETIAEAQRLDSEAESMLRKLHGGDGDLFKKYEAANVRN